MRSIILQFPLVGSLILTGCLMVAVAVFLSGGDIWWTIDWVDGRKVLAIDDAYRYFAARNAFRMESVFLWNYTLPVALFVDAVLAWLTDGSLPAMRLAHAGIGILTLVVVARASLLAGCGTGLTMASICILGTMPIYVVTSSSFYAEGLSALLIALTCLFLIAERPWALAVTAGLLPLTRPEGAIFSLLILLWFLSRRDLKRSLIILFPGMVYLAAQFLMSPEGSSLLTWRLELRRVLAPLDAGLSEAVRLVRLPNLLWAGLALSSLLFSRWRRWWPVLVAPWVIVVMQLASISRGLQGYELRYLYSVFPVFAIAWAFPIRTLLDRYRPGTPAYRGVVALTSAITLFVVGTHLLQSDPVRRAVVRKAPFLAAGLPLAADGPDLTFDTRPLRAFASRTDELIKNLGNIDTVFVSTWLPLYFLEFLNQRPDIEVVLIPHNATVASYSGGHYFGFGLQALDHRYYRFAPSSPVDARAILIASVSGQDPFNFARNGASTKLSGNPVRSRAPVTAAVQSGQLRAYPVDFSVRNSVIWRFPDADD